MPYKITSYTNNRAKQLGLIVKPSKVKGKKIDVFKGSQKIGSVGALGYMDYPTYLQKEKLGVVPKGTAANRRKLYKIRHEKNRRVKFSNGWLADQLLW